MLQVRELEDPPWKRQAFVVVPEVEEVVVRIQNLNLRIHRIFFILRIPLVDGPPYC